MSVLPPKADSQTQRSNVRFVPEADIAAVNGKTNEAATRGATVAATAGVTNFVKD
jgi:hypothetical protein